MSNVCKSKAATNTRSVPENTIGRYDTPWAPFLCRIVNCGQVAFCDDQRSASRYSCPGQAAEPEGERFVAAWRLMQAAGVHGEGAQQLRFAALASLSEKTMCPPFDESGRSIARRSDRPRGGREAAPE